MKTNENFIKKLTSLPVELPQVGVPVRAIVKYFDSWNLNVVYLYRVDEDDCCWRFYEDGSEIAFSWNVVYWEVCPEVDKIDTDIVKLVET